MACAVLRHTVNPLSQTGHTPPVPTVNAGSKTSQAVSDAAERILLHAHRSAYR
jgi:hypothetical protein